MPVKTVKVSNVSLFASKQDIREFFSFSGEIVYVEMQSSESEKSEVAFVTFKDLQGAETAALLTGATIVDQPVDVTIEDNYRLPPEACNTEPFYSDSAVKKAEDMISSMLAKGFVLGKDALMHAKSFDERHNLTSNASATVAKLSCRIGLTEKISMGTTVVNSKIKEVDEKFQVSQMTRSAFAAAEQKASNASSVIMSNPYVLSGASWVSSAFNRVAKAAGDVGSMTKEKVEKAVEEKKEIVSKHRTGMVNEYAQLYLDDDGEPATVPVVAVDEKNVV